MVWVKVKKVIKIHPNDKREILRIVTDALEHSPNAKKNLSRIVIRAGRVYVYKLYEPFQTEGTVFTEPLIDGKYFEYPWLRISIYDRTFRDCTLDWQRDNGEWMTIDQGTLEDCIVKADTSEWFED
jgi:hypothetical protein